MAIRVRALISRRHAVGAIALVVAACRGRIIEYDEYTRMKHALPYVLRFDGRRGALLFFGSDHVFDPEHEQNRQIESAWASFEPTTCFNEGGDPPTEPTTALAISKHGESGLVRFLARRDDVPVASIEPPLVDQVAMLREAGYDAPRTKVFFVLRQVPQVREQTGKVPTGEELQKILDYFSSVDGLQGPPATLDDLLEACASGELRLQGWQNVPQAWFDPALDDPPVYLNHVSRRLSEYRDEHVVALLTRAVRAGERVFAVMGASHVVVQEPALRVRLGRPRRIEQH